MNTSTSFLSQCLDPDCGFDVVIVVCSSASAASFWRQRLDASRTSVLGGAQLVVVHEQWEGRPGNGLGTLNALHVADEALRDGGTSLWGRLSEGQAVGVWHTAGLGKRLYPLPLAHHGDKSQTLLPGRVDVDAEARPIRLLEAVIRQCSPLARPGRVWVFWGDQLVLPSGPVDVPDAPVALLVRGGLEPGEAVWHQRGLHQYGIVAMGTDGRARQLEKLTWEAFQDVAGRLGRVSSVATSLGSFCMTADFAQALVRGYSHALSTRSGGVDTDPGWWMPMTLPDALARQLVGDQAVDAFVRLGIDGWMGVVDVGSHARWWDFGTLTAWRDSCRAVLSDAALRQLLGCPDPIDGAVSVLSTVRLVPGGVAVGTDAAELTVGGIAVDASGSSGLVNGVLYGVACAGSSVGADAVVCTDGAGGSVCAGLTHDGKSQWEVCLDGNRASWAALARGHSVE